MKYRTVFVREGKWESRGPGPPVHNATQAQAEAATRALNTLIGSIQQRALWACARQLVEAHERGSPSAEGVNGACLSAMRALSTLAP